MAGFVIDPNEEEAEGGGQGYAARPKMSAGDRILWAASMQYVTSSRGTKGIEVMYVCVDGEEARAYVWDTFWLTSGAAFRLRNYSRAVGRGTPWHPENAEEAQDVILQCPVNAKIVMKRRDNGDERAEIAGWGKYDGEVTKEMEAIVTEAEEHAQAMQAKKSGRGGGGGGGGFPVDNSDIPF
jgi:hypothetical protein